MQLTAGLVSIQSQPLILFLWSCLCLLFYFFLWIFKCQSSRPLPLTFQHLLSQNTVPYLWQLHHVHLLEIEQNKSLSALKYVHGKNKIFLSVRLLQFLFVVLALSVFFHIVPQPNCSWGITRGKILWIRKYQSCVTRGAAFTAVLCFKIPSLLSQSTHLGKVQLFLSQNSCMEVPLWDLAVAAKKPSWPSPCSQLRGRSVQEVSGEQGKPWTCTGWWGAQVQEEKMKRNSQAKKICSRDQGKENNEARRFQDLFNIQSSTGLCWAVQCGHNVKKEKITKGNSLWPNFMVNYIEITCKYSSVWNKAQFSFITSP